MLNFRIGNFETKFIYMIDNHYTEEFVGSSVLEKKILKMYKEIRKTKRL